jgi:eukaryotic-like serine/threonine-protein kinase
LRKYLAEHDENPSGLLGATATRTRPDVDGPDGGPDDLTAPPRTIGRFVVLRRAGRGGMGEVLSAFDEELGRRVAIKLLKKQPRARESRRARMRREAQAMAQVSHPNVIQVFEVGEHGERTFIAMEYVEGQSLEHWQRGSPELPRSREQILDAYLQAGAGLAAAHRAGVLHRDFKPANVLVDADGRVRVMDFGLAAWLRRTESTVTDGANADLDQGSFDELEMPRLTREGALVGTPAFMSPEQYRGKPLDARCDQFAFCVALYEALVGRHPFGGDTMETLRRAILEGQVYDGPAARALPSSLRRALWRGLAKEPGERWPDMESLLQALRPRPRRARWPWAVVAAASLVVAGVGWGVAMSRTGLCEGAPEQLARVWNDERRSAARAGLLRTEVSLAEGTWGRAERELDTYAEAWVATRERVCEATHVHGEQSIELMDQRMVCLDLRLEAMSSLLGVFEHADLETVLRAVDAAAQLPEPASCEKLDRGALGVAEATGPAAVELRRRLVAAIAHRDVGRADEAYAELAKIHEEAHGHELPRLAAEALVRRGQAEVDLGRIKEADTTLEAGLWAALSHGHDEIAFVAAVEHMRMVGVVVGDQARAQAGMVRAEALLQRQGDPEGARLEFLDASGTVLGRHGDYREGRARLDEALALVERLHGKRHPAYAAVLNAKGLVTLWGSDLDEAEWIFRELVELDRQIYDPKHTKVASALNNLAVVEAQKGDMVAAEQHFGEVYDVRRSALGEQHVEVADALLNLCGAMLQRGDAQAALPNLERVRAIYAASLGEGAAKTNDADIGLSMTLATLGREAEAEAVLRAVLGRQRESMGERHPDLTPTLGALGRLLTRPQDAAEAVELLQTAIEIRHKKLIAADVPLEADTGLRDLETNLAAAERVLRGEPEPPGEVPR